MFRRIALASGLLAVGAAAAVAQQPAPLTAAPSTRATATVTLNPPRGTPNATPARIRIDYGQPHLRGRALHADGLVPLDSIWRLGANEATALETDVDLTIGNQTVPKGKYTLYALPTASGWSLIINRNTGQWGTEYDAQHDLGRVSLTRRTLAVPIESFSMWLIPSTAPGSPRGELRLAWGQVELSTPWALGPAR